MPGRTLWPWGVVFDQSAGSAKPGTASRSDSTRAPQEAFDGRRAPVI